MSEGGGVEDFLPSEPPRYARLLELGSSSHFGAAIANPNASASAEALQIYQLNLMAAGLRPLLGLNGAFGAHGFATSNVWQFSGSAG